MTAAELRDYVNQERDQATNPNITDSKMSTILNKAYDVFFDTNYPDFQLDEWARQALGPLQRDYPATPSLTVNQDAIADFRLLTEFSGYFLNTCTGNYDLREIKPLGEDTFATVMNDSFAKPTNLYPRYDLLNDGTKNYLQIYADSAPNKIILGYLKRPNKIDLVGSPTAVLELQDFFMKKVGDIAVARIMNRFIDPRLSTQMAMMSKERI